MFLVEILETLLEVRRVFHPGAIFVEGEGAVVVGVELRGQALQVGFTGRGGKHELAGVAHAAVVELVPHQHAILRGHPGAVVKLAVAVDVDHRLAVAEHAVAVEVDHHRRHGDARRDAVGRGDLRAGDVFAGRARDHGAQ